jgi:hypothetical protein
MRAPAAHFYGWRMTHAALLLSAFATPPPPIRSERLTAAFARLRDAHYAVGILESAGEAPVRATVEALYDERGAMQLILLRVDLDGLGRERVLTAVAGGHGVAVPEREPGPTAQDIRTARLA